LHNSTIIWINQSYLWTYKYVDILTGNIVGSLETAFYYWYKIDEIGKPIGKSSANIDLTNATGNIYVLDFNTENREVGSYAIFVTFQKNNYEARNAFIDLTINLRIITARLSATGKEGMIISRVKGQPIVFSLVLTDPTKSSSPSSGGTIATQAAAPLTKATVKLSITGLRKTYNFIEVSKGVYNLTIETTDPAYQAFFAPQTLTANITIQKANYVTQVIDITIVIEMDQWIPGFPSFYLLMIIIGIVAVVGSLATYRYIQLAKIPKFVKDVREVKKAIKESEPISESLVYPSKEEYMANILGERFDVLGISIDDVLGIEFKKTEITPEIKEVPKPLLGKKLKSLIKKKEKKPELKENQDDIKGGEA
jgi:VCBS repeat-containing protein